MQHSGQKIRVIFACAVLPVLSPSSALANEPEAYQPYLESIQRGWDNGVVQPSDTDTPYIEQLKRKISEKQVQSEEPPEGYSERLRESNPKLRGGESSESFTEVEAKKLQPKAEGGAIEAVSQGKSSLEFKVPSHITNSFGIRFGTGSFGRNYAYDNASGQTVSFDSLYGKKLAPEISVFYEIQLVHSENFGSLGVMSLLGATAFSGTGSMAASFPDPRTGSSFSTQSNTAFQFVNIPVTLALAYRFNLLRVLRPYVVAGPTALGYFESRSDSVPGGMGVTYELYGSAGVAILLDWMSKSAFWDLYTSFGIKHSYITVDYLRLFPLAGSLKIQSSGVFVGLTFEY